MEHGQKWDVAEEGGRDKQKPEYRERSQAKGMRNMAQSHPGPPGPALLMG